MPFASSSWSWKIPFINGKIMLIPHISSVTFARLSLLRNPQFYSYLFSSFIKNIARDGKELHICVGVADWWMCHCVAFVCFIITNCYRFVTWCSRWIYLSVLPIAQWREWFTVISFQASRFRHFNGNFLFLELFVELNFQIRMELNE